MPIRPLQLFPQHGPNYRGQGAISKARYKAHFDDPVGRELRIRTALEAFADPTDARSFRRLSSDYHVNRTTLQHRRDGAKPQNKAHETAQYLSNAQEAGLEEVLRDIELLNWNVSPPVIREIAYETRRMEKPDTNRPGLHFVYRFARRFKRTVTMGKGKLEAKERHAAKDPPTVIKFLENVSSRLLIV